MSFAVVGYQMTWNKYFGMINVFEWLVCIVIRANFDMKTVISLINICMNLSIRVTYYYYYYIYIYIYIRLMTVFISKFALITMHTSHSNTFIIPKYLFQVIYIYIYIYIFFFRSTQGGEITIYGLRTNWDCIASLKCRTPCPEKPTWLSTKTPPMMTRPKTTWVKEKSL